MGANSSTLGRICNITASRSTGDNAIGTNNLPPITFHQNHGENVRLSRGGAVARRAESFCKGVAFSNRPVKINERVYLRFAETSTSWSGVIRFGFTNVDPTSIRGTLPKYVCPDFTNKPGFWAKALAERYAERDAILFYYVTQNGDVHFGINGEEKGVFLNGVDTKSPLWAVIDIYGNTIAMEFLDVRVNLNNYPRAAAVSSTASERTTSTTSSVGVATVTANENELPITYNSGKRFEIIRFHNICGRNIALSLDKTVATRRDTEFCQGYVFLQTPMRSQKRIVIQVLTTESLYVGSLAFGLTTCNPATLSSADLPEDSYSLLDRPEYWVVHKDITSSPQRGDELGFSISLQGEVLFYKNDLPPVTIMHVDHTQQLWPFIDVYANTLKIKLLGATSDSNSSLQLHPQLAATADIGRTPRGHLHVILPPINHSPRSQLKSVSECVIFESSVLPCLNDMPHSSMLPSGITQSESFVAGLDGIQDNANNECSICYERAVDSVLYSCGHMCMCFECAQQLWHRPGGGQCPICRADIRDVIRTYRS